MIDWSTVKTALYTWLDGQESVQVIYANQNAPSPSVPYTVYKIASSSGVGQDYIGLPDEDGDSLNTGNREFTVEIQAIGTDSLSRLEKLRSSLERQSVQLALALNGIAIIEAGQVLDITSLDGVLMEERAIMEVRFRIAQTDAIEDVDYIETVEVIEDHRSPDDVTVYQGTITITV